MVADMGMTNKQFQGFIRLALELLEKALQKSPDNEELRKPDFYSFAVKINTINTQKTRNLNIFGFFCYFLFTLCSIYSIIRYIYTWRLT